MLCTCDNDICFLLIFHVLQLKEDIQVRSNEAQREARKKEKTEKELKQAKNDLETRTAELRTKAGNLQRAQEDITKLEQQLKEQRVGSFVGRNDNIVILMINAAAS